MIKKRIFDIHSHIIYDVDDGSKSIDMSLEMIKRAYEVGVEEIIATPHYNLPRFDNNKSQVQNKFKKLCDTVEKNGIDVKFYLGNEIMFSLNMLEDLEELKSFSLGNSKYILLEFPLFQDISVVENELFKLQLEGYKIILAHVERYLYIQKDIKMLESLINRGLYAQITLGSLTGLYGSVVKKTCKKIVNKQLFHFVGLDSHNTDSKYYDIQKSITYIAKKVSSSKLEDVLYNNANRIFNNN